MTTEPLHEHVVDLLPLGGLEEKLKLGRPLRVKLGIDLDRRPTSISGSGACSTGWRRSSGPVIQLS